MDLLEAWADWEAEQPPYLLDADRGALSSRRSSAALVTYESWEAAYRSDDFAAPGDTRLHVGLLPQPYFGDLLRASVYILLLNPGLGPTDYYGEYNVPSYRKALLAGYRQEFTDRLFPFPFLDPQFAWHGGFDWWHRKFAGVIAELASAWAVSFAEARKRLATQLASIELLPYHSETFRDADGWLRNLPSVALVRAFVADVVLPRVRSGEAIVIATRQTRMWGLPTRAGIVQYTAKQARAAHLTPASPGGQAILSHLLSSRV